MTQRQGYFFKNDHYVRINVQTDLVDVGPAPIRQFWGLPEFFHSDLDVAVNWGNGKLYFFKRDHYVRYDLQSDLVDVGPAPIAKFWTHLPKSFQSDIGAAVNWGNGKVYFFKKDQYVRYDTATDLVDVGPAAIGKFWTHLPEFFRSDLDSVINWGNGKVYFFKADHYVRYDIATDVVDVGPAPIGQFWTHLPGAFQSNIGAAVRCGEERHEILFCVLTSGISAQRAKLRPVPAGIPGSERLAQNDRGRVAALKSVFEASAQAHSLPPALLAAIASHESDCGASLDANGNGDNGAGFGIMQVDRGTRPKPKGVPDPRSRAHIDEATGILNGKLKAIRKLFPNGSAERQLQGAVAAYNGTPKSLEADQIDDKTTTKDYSSDVWARARYYAEHWSDL